MIKKRTKLEKVFDNTFYESDINNESVDFHSPEFIEDGNGFNPIELMCNERLLDQIDSIVIKQFPEFKTSEVKLKRLNKDITNKLYSTIRKQLIEEHTVVDIWYYTSYYFNINYQRFYDSLKDEYKSELITYLSTNTKLMDKRSLDIF